MIGIPRQMRECRIDENGLVLVVQISLLDLAQSIAVASFVAALDGQDVNRRVFVLWCNGTREQNPDLGLVCLECRLHLVDEDAVLIHDGR